MDDRHNTNRPRENILLTRGFEDWKKRQDAEAVAAAARATKIAEAHQYLRPVTEPPPLRRVNGFGITLLGWLEDHELPGTIKLLWVTALFLPLVPLAAYVVTPVGGGFRFHYQMGLIRFVRRYRWRVLGYYATVWLESLLWLTLIVGLLLAVAAVLGAFR